MELEEKEIAYREMSFVDTVYTMAKYVEKSCSLMYWDKVCVRVYMCVYVCVHDDLILVISLLIFPYQNIDFM